MNYIVYFFCFSWGYLGDGIIVLTMFLGTHWSFCKEMHRCGGLLTLC